MKEKQLSLFKLLKFNKNPDKEIPKNIHLEKNQLWCPYCSNIVVFVRDKRLGVKKCPICSITINDYWVKKVNHLV
jgi:hypothetical protein